MCHLAEFLMGYFTVIVGLDQYSHQLDMDFIWCLDHLIACCYFKLCDLLQRAQHWNSSATKFSSLWITFDFPSRRSYF